MRIVRRLSEDSCQDPPHDTSLGPAWQFGYFCPIWSGGFCHDLPHVINQFIMTLFKFSLCIIIVRFTFIRICSSHFRQQLKRPQHDCQRSLMYTGLLFHTRCPYYRLRLHGLSGTVFVNVSGEFGHSQPINLCVWSFWIWIRHTTEGMYLHAMHQFVPLCMIQIL